MRLKVLVIILSATLVGCAGHSASDEYRQCVSDRDEAIALGNRAADIGEEALKQAKYWKTKYKQAARD